MQVFSRAVFVVYNSTIAYRVENYYLQLFLLLLLLLIEFYRYLFIPVSSALLKIEILEISGREDIIYT